MLSKLFLIGLSSSLLLAGCGTDTKKQDTADSQGIAVRGEAAAVRYPNLKKLVQDPQLKALLSSEEISFWIYTKDFNSEGSSAKDINVCFYAAKIQRSESTVDNDPKDHTRFMNNASVLKNGKYISWNKFFTLINALANQEIGSAGPGKAVSNAEAAGMKEMIAALKLERKKLTSGVDVLEKMQVLGSTLQGGVVASGPVGFLSYGQYVSSAEKNVSAQAALLIALERTPALAEKCPSKKTVSERIHRN